MTAALGFGLEAVESRGLREPRIPLELLSQARFAARSGVSLDTVLRRYFAGYSLLGYAMVEEADRGGLMAGEELKRLLGELAGTFDRLIVAVTEEHRREGSQPRGGLEERRVQRVRQLLDGEAVDSGEISYPLHGHHLGIAIAGSVEADILRELARSLDRRLLLVRPEPERIWMWLGGGEVLDLGSALGQLWDVLPTDCVAAVGEPGEGVESWRLSLRQALAALPVAQRATEPVVRYREVALLAAVMRDELLAASLQRLYLEPLQSESDGGVVLRDTLRAYRAAAGNLSAAAATLSVSRRTVSNRLRRVEELLGVPHDAVLAELDTALRMSRLESADPGLSTTELSESRIGIAARMGRCDAEPS